MQLGEIGQLNRYQLWGKSLALPEKLGELLAAANAANDVNIPYIQPATTSAYPSLATATA